ncbi:SDR family NAD(P)-dependent oxidoreductase [Microbacterium sp. zg.B48]|uniref:SDR family NAD(P)-dependent oxidoreductase n=1 Tax=Microbacterium sp. zg.B48 TaxID=2969408 RepID=UPI00214BD4E9|nr:SDR family NAD(P)-dependent oxidoreductase [Microbacterium sp. zg.B48]MCR2764350.1 SDR family NAD(P)-dependent oxidoreductase [Microbacterium sp. zg.B48]
MASTTLRFDGRVAIVTGAGRGLGEAYASALAARGAAVVVNDLGCDVYGEGSDPEVAEAVAESLRRSGGTAIAHTEDVSESEGATGLVEAALREWGRLDIVVANAAIRRARTLADVSMLDAMTHIKTDLIGTMLVTQAAWPHFVEAGYGRLVVSSSSAIFGSDRAVPYALAKGAVTVLGRSYGVHAEGIEGDIKANVVAPYALTRMLRGVFDHDPEALDLRRRFGGAERAAETVVVLSHELCPVNANI